MTATNPEATATLSGRRISPIELVISVMTSCSSPIRILTKIRTASLLRVTPDWESCRNYGRKEAQTQIAMFFSSDGQDSITLPVRAFEIFFCDREGV